MNPKTTVILLVVFLLAIAGAIYISKDAKPADPSNASQQTALNDTSSDAIILDSDIFGSAVKQFTINLHDDIIDAKQFTGQWQVTRPHPFRCHTPKIDEMLGMLGNLQGTVIDQADLHTLTDQTHDGVGMLLGQPEQVITLNPGITPIDIRLHKRLGAGRGGVSIIIDKQVTFYNANDSLHEFFETIDPYSFYPRSIQPLLMPETRRVEITAGNNASVLTQQDGRWHIGEGENAERALEMQLDQRPGVNNYFALLKAIEIQDFHAYDRDAGLEAFGLHKPLITARFVPMDSKPNNRAAGKMLRIGVPADAGDQTRFACYSSAADSAPLVFTIPTPVALAFGQDATAFRDPRIVDLAPSLIESIETKPPVQDGEPLRDQILLFDIDSPPILLDESREKTPLPPTACRAMLESITTPQASAYIKHDSTALKIRVVDVRARLGGRSQTFSVFIDPASSPQQPTVLIRRGLEPVMLRIPIQAVAALLDPTLLITEDDE